MSHSCLNIGNYPLEPELTISDLILGGAQMLHKPTRKLPSGAFKAQYLAACAAPQLFKLVNGDEDYTGSCFNIFFPLINPQDFWMKCNWDLG